VTTELLDADESAIEDRDGGGGIGVAVGATGGAMAVALGLLVFCLLRRHRMRKQKQQLVTLESSNGASSSTLTTTVNQTTLDTGDKFASGPANLLAANPVWPPRRNPLPTTNVDIHLDLEKDQLKPAVSLAPAPSLVRRTHSMGGGVPRRARIEAAAAIAKDSEPSLARRTHSMSGSVPRRARIEAAAAIAKDSEASETDEVQRGGKSPQPRKMWLGGDPNPSPNPNPIPKHVEI